MSTSSSLRRRVVAAGVVLFFISVGLVGPSQASQTFGATVDRSVDLIADGDTVSVTLANLPEGRGVYVLQCAAPETAGARPTLCNATTQQWVTATVPPGTPGVAAPGAPVRLAVAAAFTSVNRATNQSTTVDCSTRQCGVFVRLDHFATMDRSLDTFIPVSFSGSTIVLPADVLTVTAQGVAVGTRAPLNLRYRTPVVLEIAAQSGQQPTVTSINTNCTVEGTRVTAVRGSGECAFQITTPRTATTAPGRALIPAFLAPADQVIEVAVPRRAKVGVARVLAPSSARSSMDQRITWSTSTPGCRVTVARGSVRLMATTRSTCVVTATAPARDGLWSSATRSFEVVVR